MDRNKKQCLKINGTVFAVNILVYVFLVFRFGGYSALPFCYGALLAQIFSVTWFLITVPLLNGPYFFIAAAGGFFLRLIVLSAALLGAFYCLHLDAFAAAVSFLIVRFVLIIFEIRIAVTAAGKKPAK